MAEKGCWPDWDMAFGRDFCKRRYPPSPTPYRAPRAALVSARLQPRSAARVAAASSQALVRLGLGLGLGFVAAWPWSATHTCAPHLCFLTHEYKYIPPTPSTQAT